MFFTKKEHKADIENIVKVELRDLPTKVEMKRWLKVLRDKECSCYDLSIKIVDLEEKFSAMQRCINNFNVNELHRKLNDVENVLRGAHLEELKSHVGELTHLISLTYGRKQAD